MEKILIVEDNITKLDKLQSFCSVFYPESVIIAKNSYNTALSEIVRNGSAYDVILLDVSMYTYDVNNEDNGGEPEPLAGSNILRFMKLRKITTPVIVVTMYESFVDGVKIDELNKGFKTNYPEFYKGYVYFSHKNDDWKTYLKTKLESL